MAKPLVERKLAAVLAADVAGYSRLMGADETGTLAALKKHRNELIDPKVAEYRGRLVKETGDGLLVEFPSVVAAVECAIAVQRAVAERNVVVPLERRIEFRVGVNLGDVIVDGSDIYGNGVNLAARLEATAEPGGVCLSQAAYEQCRGNIDVAFADLGEQRLKNIADPVRVWTWSMAREAGAPADELAAARAVLARPAIAVLPFENMSGDPTQEYFADGISEEIITALARRHDFPVIARNSTFAYKGRKIDVVRVAKEVGARYMLEGSVRRAGGRVRVTAQLIDGDNGHHIWAERYDRDLADIFAVQDEITEKVAAEVTPAVRLAEIQRVARKPPGSLDAWDHYLRALASRALYTRDGDAEAIRELQAAIRLDPNFAAAHALMAIVWCHTAVKQSEDRSEAVAKALAHAQRASRLDASDDKARAALSLACVIDGRFGAGITAARDAIALNPNSPDAWWPLALGLLFSGDAEKSLEAAQRSIALGPHEPWLWFVHALMAVANYLVGRYEECIEWGRRSLALHSDNNRSDGYVVAALARLGREREARTEAAAIRQRWPDFGPQVYSALPFQPEQRDALLDGLRKAGIGG